MSKELRVILNLCLTNEEQKNVLDVSNISDSFGEMADEFEKKYREAISMIDAFRNEFGKLNEKYKQAKFECLKEIEYR